MHNKKLYSGLLIAAMVAVIWFLSYNIINAGREEEYYSVAVIVNDSGNNRWNAFKEGIEQGVLNNNIYLNIVSTTSFLNLEEETQIIERELENGADAVIIQACADDQNGILSGILLAKPAVLVGNDIQSEQLFDLVEPNQYELGRAIAENIRTGEEGREGTLRVGILTGNQSMESQRKRLEGLLSGLSGIDVQIVWEYSREEAGQIWPKEVYDRENAIDVLVALDSDETEQAIDFCLSHADENWHIYGEGRSEKAVYYLDKGLVEALVVPNEFYMGYQAGILICQKLNYYEAPAEKSEVDFLSVTKENLYNKETEKILFPTVS